MENTDEKPNAFLAPNMVQQMLRTEVDIQVATAHQWPRSMTKIARNVMSLVTISARAAEKCTYALPRGGKPITGPSIRLAEIVAGQWGNCRYGSRVVDVNKAEKYVEAEGVFHDLESNAATTARVRRRISDKNGNLLSDDMIIVTGNAAAAIALRNAIFRGIPEAIWGEAYESALATIKGDVKTLPERRDAAMKAMAAFGLTPEQVYALLGIAGAKDLGLDQLVTLTGLHNALKTEETTAEELLRSIGEGGPARRPGQISGARPAAPAPNPSEAMIEKEAARVEAQRRKADEEAREAGNLANAYEALTGQKPDGRWNIDTLRSRVQAAQAEVEAMRRQRMQDERDAARAQRQDEEPPHDPETGEVMEEEADEVTEAAPAVRTPDRAAFEAIYDRMVNEIIDGASKAQIEEIFGSELSEMRRHFPDMYNSLNRELDEADAG